MILTIFIFIVILGVVVLVHEWGHYITAKRSGVAVEEFGFGFPPRAKKLFKNKSGTWITLNWLPIGGFVKLKGEAGDLKNEDDSFSHKAAWKRALILVAGVGMNVILAIVIFSVAYTIGIPKAIDGIPTQFATIRNQELQIVDVFPESPAEHAGLSTGDAIISINGETVENAQLIRDIAKNAEITPATIVYQHDGDQRTIILSSTSLAFDTTQPTFGISTLSVGTVSYPFWYAIWMGIKETISLLWLVLTALWAIIANIFTHQPLSEDLVGPVGVAVITGKFVELGFIYVLQFAALISLNLAIINIFPFPALDGGRLLFLAIEKIKGSPINQKTEALIHNIGFIVLLILVGIITVRDLFNIDKISNLF